MLKVVIIEDERPAVENLISTLGSIANDLKVIATLASVQESINFFSAQTGVDLIFCDVQLSDGYCFEIFNRQSFCIPVIFVSGFDKYILQAFESNGIDYLLKPIDKQALAKYRMLDSHFTDQGSMHRLLHAINPERKKRMIVKKGTESISLLMDDIVLFHSENKWVHAIDRYGNKYLVDKNLTDLEDELDKHLFFRANRQYIIHINFIRGFTAYERVKLKVHLTVPDINFLIIVSQETAHQFKEWMFRA
jgi:DNA-binding LytR/AlgR family response regulator